MTNMKRLLNSTAFFLVLMVSFVATSMDVNLSSTDVTYSFVSKEYMPVTFHEDFQFSDNYNYIVEATVVEAFSKLIECDSIFLPYNIKDISGGHVVQPGITYLPHYITKENSIVSVRYFDGLGRLEQSVHVGADALDRDLAGFIEYNARGLQEKNWLPAIGSGSGQFTPQATLDYSIYEDSKTYSSAYYETSVEARLVEAKKPGMAWEVANGVKSSYHLNTGTGEFACKRYVVNQEDGSLSPKGTYPKNNLRIIKTTDEDNREVLTFKDMNDSTILIRRKCDGRFLDTYYVYDIHHRLRYILPPMGAESLKNVVNDVSVSNEVISKYCYCFNYNGRGLLTKKKNPGAGAIDYVYDKAGNLRYSQDGNQRSRQEWTFYAYDSFDRLIYSGVVKDIRNASVLAETMRNNCDKAYFDGETAPYGYSSVMALNDGGEIYEVYFYDDYRFVAMLESSNNNLSYQDKYGYDKKYTSPIPEHSTRGMLTGKLVKVLDGAASELLSVYYYGLHGNLVQSRETNYKGGYDVRYYKLTFSGKPKEVRHEYSTADTSHVDIYTYKYDRNERLLSCTHQHDTKQPVTLYENGYNILGQLVSTKVLGMKEDQTFTYNIQGWLTNIKGPAFAQTIGYEPTETNPQGLYGGSVSMQNWTVVNKNNNVKETHKGRYNYTYDQAGRLISARHGGAYHTYRKLGVSEAVKTARVKEDYSAEYAYDANSNLTAINRRGPVRSNKFIGSGSRTYYYGTIDSLKIERNGNQLRKVTDFANEVILNGSMDFKDGAEESSEYSWDSNGNMTRDLNKGISKIEYNYLNQPERILFSDGHIICNIYDASGRKMQTKYMIDNATVVNPQFAESENFDDMHQIVPEKRLAAADKKDPIRTYMTRDYCGNYEYENGRLIRINTENGYIDGNGIYNAYIKDCQGNNRVTVSYTGQYFDVTNYYPYGMPYADLNGYDRYKYSGKEIETANGLNHYDFHARSHDFALGQFTCQDKKAVDYASVSPYTYCTADPVNNIDPTGEDGVRIIDDKNKTITVRAVYFVVTEDQKYREGEDIKTVKGYSNADIKEMNDYNSYLNGIKLSVSEGEYKGYKVLFDLVFKDGKGVYESEYFAGEEKYLGYPVGNRISKGHYKIQKKVGFELKINPDGTTSVVGAVTDGTKKIYMNVGYDTKMNRLHEIFHTLGFTHPAKEGGKEGIMHYPPLRPSQRDADEIANSKFLPTIKK